MEHHDAFQLGTFVLALFAVLGVHSCVCLQSWLPVPYFASERSFAQFKLPEATRSIVGFGPQQTTLLVVSTTGTFYSATFDADKGGNCQQQTLSSFLQKKQPF